MIWYFKLLVLAVIPCLSLTAIIFCLSIIDKEKQKRETKIGLKSREPFVVKKTLAEKLIFLFLEILMCPFLIWAIVEKFDIWVIFGFSAFVILPLIPLVYYLFFSIKVDPEKDYIERVLFGIKSKFYYKDMIYYKELPKMGYVIKTSKKHKFILFSFMDLFGYHLVYNLNCNGVKVIKKFK